MLSGLVPLVGITSGRCFAGNTALLACCDVIIATANSTIAMGGPAMIEGGGLGVCTSSCAALSCLSMREWQKSSTTPDAIVPSILYLVPERLC